MKRVACQGVGRTGARAEMEGSEPAFDVRVLLPHASELLQALRTLERSLQLCSSERLHRIEAETELVCQTRAEQHSCAVRLDLGSALLAPPDEEVRFLLCRLFLCALLLNILQRLRKDGGSGSTPAHSSSSLDCIAEHGKYETIPCLCE